MYGPGLYDQMLALFAYLAIKSVSYLYHRQTSTLLHNGQIRLFHIQ